MAVNMLEVSFSLKERNKIMDEIKSKVCALLNSNGGHLLLKATDGSKQNKIKADDIVRPIEQYFEKVMTTFNVYKCFNILRQTNDEILLDVKGSPELCTLNYNLFLPTDTQNLPIPARERKTVKRILVESRIVEITDIKIPYAFVLGRDSDLRESKTVEFKQMKTKKGNWNGLVKQMINSKITHYISAFANSSGGSIYYGINDNGIVEGKELLDDDKGNVVEKVEEAISQMLWMGYSNKLQKGEQWDIIYVPVNDTRGKVILSTYVIVISVKPCPGGVFVRKPKSYHIVNGQVEVMDFPTWRDNLLKKEEEREVVPFISRSRWSKKAMETQYMKLTEHLENLRQLGMWNRIESGVKSLKCRRHLNVNAELVLLFQCTAVAYRQHNFDEAEGYLKEFSGKVSSAEDPLIFGVEELYSSAALARSRGDYGKSWTIIRDGLQVVEQAPAGLVPAAFYHLAASIISILINDESFIGVKRQHKDFIRLKKLCCSSEELLLQGTTTYRIWGRF